MAKVIMMMDTLPLIDKYELHYIDERATAVMTQNVKEPYLIIE